MCSFSRHLCPLYTNIYIISPEGQTGLHIHTNRHSKREKQRQTEREASKPPHTYIHREIGEETILIIHTQTRPPTFVFEREGHTHYGRGGKGRRNTHTTSGEIKDTTARHRHHGSPPLPPHQRPRSLSSPRLSLCVEEKQNKRRECREKRELSVFATNKKHEKYPTKRVCLFTSF